MIDANIQKELEAKLDDRKVKERRQAGRTFSYVEGWHVIAEANRIFGFDGWSRETIGMECVWTGEVNGKPACTYIARVRIIALGCPREGTGTGHGYAKGMGDAHESAVKEAETDAMKRAFITFGWPFGLALYDKEQEHVGSGEQDSHDVRPDDASAKDDIADFTDADIERARGGFSRIREAIRSAAKAQLIDEIMRLQAWDLDLIAKIYPDSHEKLVNFANERRADLSGEP